MYAPVCRDDSFALCIYLVTSNTRTNENRVGHPHLNIALIDKARYFANNCVIAHLFRASLYKQCALSKTKLESQGDDRSERRA